MNGLYKLTKPKSRSKNVTLLSRLNKELKEMSELPNSIQWIQSEDDITKFQIFIIPDEGTYKGGRFHFTLDLPANYPYEAPRVKCKQTIYHPNINLQGDVCLSILRDDWSPAGTLTMILLGLLHLFYEPNPNDPLNVDAAEEMAYNGSIFAGNVRQTMKGYSMKNVQYSNVMN